jgi:hypothetical protein
MGNRSIKENIMNYITLAWQNKTIRTITITALVMSVLFSMCGCAKSEGPDCQSCHTQEWVLDHTGQWLLIQTMGFTDCSLLVRNEDRTYECAGDTYRRVTKCVK